MRAALRAAAKRVFGALGLEVRRQKWLAPAPPPPAAPAAPEPARATMRAVLDNMVRHGLQVETVIDVGAAHGTADLYAAFPDARHLLFEPLAEFAGDLHRWVARLRRAELIAAAAARAPGAVTLHVHPDLVGSSLRLEDEDSDVNGQPRTVPGLTIDGVCRDRQTRGPYLIKLDTQGTELDALAGGEAALQAAACVIMEVSLFQFFRGGPLVHDCIAFMQQRGFVVYDVFDFQYRLLDSALSQMDIAFVRATGRLREHHFYASRDQRARQNGWLLEVIGHAENARSAVD